jgi:phage N-6-adenine-methyltransferase
VTRGYAFAHPSDLETTDSWATPQALVDELAAEFAPGGFDLDPAADEVNHKAPAYYTREQNGLLQPWSVNGKPSRVFTNPPYGRNVGLWLAKARTEVAMGRAEVVVALVAVRTGSKWWHTHVIGHAEIRYLKGRVKFTRGDGPIRESPPFDSAVLIYR